MYHVFHNYKTKSFVRVNIIFTFYFWVLKAYDVDILGFTHLVVRMEFSPIKTPHMGKSSTGGMDPAEACLTLTLSCVELDEFIMRSYQAKFIILCTSCTFESVCKFLFSCAIIFGHTLHYKS